MASEGVSLVSKELSLGGVVGASEVLVFTEGSPLRALLETKRALTGTAIRAARRLAAPPILNSDIVSFWMRGMVVASEDSLQVWFGCELQAGHDTTESGLAGLGKPNTRRARFVPPSSSISFLWFTCAANQRKSTYLPPCESSLRAALFSATNF
mgnify:FL=1|jgi:hypothetical protein